MAPGSDWQNATELNVAVAMPAGEATKIVVVAQSTVDNATRDFVVRKGTFVVVAGVQTNNMADTSLLCTLAQDTGTNTAPMLTCTGTGSVNFNDGDLMTIGVNDPVNNPGQTSLRICIEYRTP
jgi:hypothetical protein